MCYICEFRDALYSLMNKYEINDKGIDNAIEYLDCICTAKECLKNGECDCSSNDQLKCKCYLSPSKLKNKNKTKSK